MSALPSLLTDPLTLTAVTGFAYTAALVSAAVVSVAARNPTRRRDARATLAILVRRRSRT